VGTSGAWLAENDAIASPIRQGHPPHQREVGLAVREAILGWIIPSVTEMFDQSVLCCARLPLIPLNGDVPCKPLNSRTYCSSGAPRVMVPFPRSVSIQKAIWKQRMVSLSALRVIAAGAENWLALRSTSVIRGAPGSAAQMKTRMDYYDNTSPKRTDLSAYTQSDLDKVALCLDQRPRKTRGIQTPASRLRATVASSY